MHPVTLVVTTSNDADGISLWELYETRQIAKKSENKQHPEAVREMISEFHNTSNPAPAQPYLPYAA